MVRDLTRLLVLLVKVGWFKSPARTWVTRAGELGGTHQSSAACPWACSRPPWGRETTAVTM